ncbi:hypothetical protein KR067_005382 [Drosophila pandora]|nr:hypothetical protein KR067_005382 [Drosophila pandora]
MWTRKYKPRPPRRLPLVHEQIVMQCARNIVRVAAALPQPQPRCPSGHIPVLVELRRTDDAAIYRYQVNLPPSGWPQDDPTEAGSDEHLPMVVHAGGSFGTLGIKGPERPPCPMHGHSVPDAATAIECWSPPSPGGSSDSSTLPPMVFRQSSMHVINGLSDPPVIEDISTFCEPAVSGEAADPIRAHFMATLFQQERSPLYYSEIWLQEGSHPPRFQITPPMPPPDNGSDNVGSCRESRPINGFRRAVRATMKEDRKIAELCLDSNGEYVKNELLQRPINGFAPFPITAAGFPKLPLNGINGFRGEIFGYGYVSEEHAGGAIIKNGFMTGEPIAAYSDQDKVMWLRSQGGQLGQEQEQETASCQAMMVPLSVQGQGQFQDSTSIHFEGSVDSLEKPPLASVTDLGVTSTEPSAHYPMELQTLFRWNYCSLCHTAMRTVRNAVDHYSSRAHDRRVSSWLVRQCVAQTNISGLSVGVGVGPSGGIGFGLGVTSGIGPGGGGGSISVSGVGNGATAEVLRYLRTTRPADFYCDLCDLKLTSVMHAQQHFFGRRHRMVARNQTKPNGEGYYDMEGRWVRTDAKWLMCELCDVSITSESQMAMHMAGARHRRRVHTHYASSGGYGGLTMAGMDFGSGYAGGTSAGSGGVTTFNGSHMYRVNANGTLVPLNPLEVPVFINQAPTSPVKTSATPTLKPTTISVPNLCHLPPRPLNDQNAAYYCEACNVTLNHLKSVKQHEDGRLHRRNLQRMPGKAIILE